MRRGALVAATALLGGCLSLPVPGPTDVDRARVSGRDTTVELLTEGRSAYLSRCGTCHQHYLPSSHPAAEWPKIVEDMRERSKLDPALQAKITDYLVILADAPPPP